MKINTPEDAKAMIDEVKAKGPEMIEQVAQVIDELITHLFSLKKAVADLREKSQAGVSTSTGVLTDEQAAALLSRRDRAIAKRFHQ